MLEHNTYLNPREQSIRLFYTSLLDRSADLPGLKSYIESDRSLEMIYLSLYTSDEAVAYREKKEAKHRVLLKEGPLPLTLAMFVKDSGDCVAMAINSVKSIVREIIVVDTGSTDNTISICEDLGARVYKVGFSDFGSIRTLTGHLATQPWVLGLDSDETILESDHYLLAELISNDSVDIWGLPRKRWLDLEMTSQVEEDVYPDWQYRLFRNKPTIYYSRRVHEVIEGSDKRRESDIGPHIQHFQDVFKQGPKLEERNIHYKELYNQDICEGVKHSEQAVQDIDER